jgi:uncharacterized protein (TIGR00304 family)
LSLYRFAPFLFLVGIILITVGAFVSFGAGLTQGQVSTGGVIFIGPLPIVFGSGPGYQYLTVMALLIAMIMIGFVLYYVIAAHRYYRAAKEDKPE